MIVVRTFIAGAFIAFALASVGCEPKYEGPMVEQPLAGMSGGTAGVGGTGGLAGMTAGAAGVGGTGGLAGMTAGAAGASTGGVGGIGGIGGVAGMTNAMAGAGGMAGTAGAGGAGGAAAGGAGGMVGQTDAIPCAVDAVVIQACHRCHGADTRFGAPMALATLADFQRDYVAISTKQLKGQSFKMYELARIRINREMGTSLMPQGPTLSDEDMTTLNTWLVNGAPGGAACVGP
jgi:hypothetical protein